MTEYLDPLTIGRWEGSRFVFDEPLTVATEGGRMVELRELETAGMWLDEGITKDDVVHAVVNNMRVEDD